MSWQFVLFNEIIALKTLVKGVTVAFIVNFICKIKGNLFSKRKINEFMGHVTR